MLGHERLAALDALRAHAAQIGFVRLDELGLRAVGLDGLPMEADRRQHGVERLGADAALERRAADLAQERLKRRLVGRGVWLLRGCAFVCAARGAARSSQTRCNMSVRFS